MSAVDEAAEPHPSTNGVQPDYAVVVTHEKVLFPLIREEDFTPRYITQKQWMMVVSDKLVHLINWFNP